MKLKKMILVLSAIGLLMSGCYKQPLDREEPLPAMIWPKPPEIPRVHFVNSISGPEDLHIRESGLRRLFNLLTGAEKRSIIKPYGLETDSEGRFFVVDAFNKYVHVFDEKNSSYYKFPGEDISLEYPIDIAVDRKANVYITDSKRAVVKIFRDNGREYEGEIGKGVLKRPTGIAVNEITGELLVVDTRSSQIIRYDLESRRLKGTVGRDGEEKGMFHYPTNIFVSKDGRIFVSDSLNFRVQIFTHDWKFLDSFGKAGKGPGFFSRPRGVAVDSDGNIYVVDALFDNVQIFNGRGTLLMDFGGPGHKHGEFWLPSGIFIDGRDRIYVSDTYNKRIQVFQYIKEGEF